METIHSIIRIKFYFIVRNNDMHIEANFSVIYNNLVCYRSNYEDEERICLFDPYSCSVEKVAKFHNWYLPYKVAITQNKVKFYVHYFE